MPTSQHHESSARAFALLALAGGSAAPRRLRQAAADTAAAPTPEARDAFPGMEADLAAHDKGEPDYYPLQDGRRHREGDPGPDLGGRLGPPVVCRPRGEEGRDADPQGSRISPARCARSGPDANASFRPVPGRHPDVLRPNARHRHRADARRSPDASAPSSPQGGRWIAPNKTVYFKLDPDAKWSDGVPFTTDDIVFSWYLYRSPLPQRPVAVRLLPRRPTPASRSMTRTPSRLRSPRCGRTSWPGSATRSRPCRRCHGTSSRTSARIGSASATTGASSRRRALTRSRRRTSTRHVARSR